MNTTIKDEFKGLLVLAKDSLLYTRDIEIPYFEACGYVRLLSGDYNRVSRSVLAYPSICIEPVSLRYKIAPSYSQARRDLEPMLSGDRGTVYTLVEGMLVPVRGWGLPFVVINAADFETVFPIERHLLKEGVGFPTSQLHVLKTIQVPEYEALAV